MTDLKVGPYKYGGDGGLLRFGVYAEEYGGGIAIWIETPQCEMASKATVNLHEYEISSCGRYVWLKGWSENEGLPQALADAGHIELTGVFVPAGFAYAQLARLSDVCWTAAQEAVGAPIDG